MKKVKFFIPVVILLAAAVYFFPISGEKALKSYNDFDINRVYTVSYRPVDNNKDLQTMEIRPGNRQLSDYINNLKVRRILPFEKTDYFYHDGYTFYSKNELQKTGLDMYVDEWLIAGNTWYKILS